MKKLYIVLLPFLFASCASYKMNRIYEPTKKDNLIEGLDIKFDSTSVEYAMLQNRLKLDFTTQNSETNSTLIAFNYYKPDHRPVSANYLSVPQYESTTILDLSAFKKMYGHYLMNDDTLLCRQGLQGIELYIEKNSNSQTKISGTPEDEEYEVKTVVPILRYPKSYTDAVFQNSKTKNGAMSPYYNPSLVTMDNVITTGEVGTLLGAGIASAILSKRDQNEELKSIHNTGTELTEANKNKDIVLLNKYRSDVLPMITDFYKLTNDFTTNELINPFLKDQNNYQGFIKFCVINKEHKGEYFWMVPTLLVIPTLLGCPIFAEKVEVVLEASIYNKKNHKIKTYIAKGHGKGYTAFYWGYTNAAYSKWSPSSRKRAANSKALYTALLDIKQQILRDKQAIERYLNENQ